MTRGRRCGSAGVTFGSVRRGVGRDAEKAVRGTRSVTAAWLSGGSDHSLLDPFTYRETIEISQEIVRIRCVAWHGRLCYELMFELGEGAEIVGSAENLDDAPSAAASPSDQVSPEDPDGLAETIVQLGCLESAVRLEQVRVIARADQQQLWVADGQTTLA